MKRLRFWIALLILPVLAGCQPHGRETCEAPGDNPTRYELTAMDTFMTMTIYNQPGGTARKYLRQAAGLLQELDALLSVTDEDSEIYQANHGGGAPATLSDDTRRLLTEALALCKETEGALDVTVYPVVRAWGFTTGEYRVPEDTELSALLEQVDYTRVTLDGDTLALPAGMELDLGAVAKGYAGDRIMDLFRSTGMIYSIVELGGNVQALGTKPDGSPWRVAVQAPEGGCAGALEIVGKAVVTSGGYQRYFEQDGEIYCHIIDPASGLPVRNGLASATIVADRGIQADALSTALFVMGRERAEAYWRDHSDFDFILLGEDGTVAITEGLEDCFSLCGAWVDHPLEVIRR